MHNVICFGSVHNTATHSATGFSPNMLTYDRALAYPNELIIICPCRSPGNIT